MDGLRISDMYALDLTWEFKCSCIAHLHALVCMYVPRVVFRILVN